MKKAISIMMALVLSVLVTACTSTPAGTDAENGAQTTAAPATKRVIAGTVSAMQYLDALGADVVAIPTTDKEVPANYQGKPEIGMPMSPNLEMILAQTPDIFIADMNLKATLDEMFYGKNVDVILLDNNSYDSIATNINLLAEKLGLESKAEEVITQIEAKKQAALAKAEGKEQPKVAVIFGTTAMFMLATDSSCVGSMVELLGAPNITDDLGLGDAYVTFDREKLAELNPDVILRLSHADPAETAKAFETEFSKPFWQQIEAVKNNRVYDLDIEYFGVTANYKTIDAPSLLADMLYN